MISLQYVHYFDFYFKFWQISALRLMASDLNDQLSCMTKFVFLLVHIFVCMNPRVSFCLFVFDVTSYNIV